jgi:uncharacterized membrane protein
MDPILYVVSVNGLLLLLSIIFKYFPPKKVNGLYGYRTPRSMANQEIWDFANNFFNAQLLKYSLISFVAALVFALIAAEISWQPIGFMVITLAVCVIKTEQELNKFYDKEGNKLKK